MTAKRGCTHKDPTVDVTDVWPEARSVMIGSRWVDSWCTVCGAVWLAPERASAFGFDSAIWVRPTGEVT